ncbi:MAG: PHP domain-containing protein [Microthrixaceae bacterium]|nr:PHP domain-containing protein [Microthrixaceae bacterium]
MSAMSGSVEIATAALRQAVYYLDRSLAPAPKVRAFRTAMKVVESLDDSDLVHRVAAGTITELDGIGPSTGAVITEAFSDAPGGYLAKLEKSTRLDVGEGAELRSRLRGDCHLHSTWSDGGASIEDMARTAISLGHEYMVLTDHSPRLTVAHGLTLERLEQQRIEIERLNELLAPFRILRGCEVDINEDGSLDHPDDVLAGLDIVVASVHSKLKMPAEEMTRRMVMAVANPHVDILGHCTGRQIVGTNRAPSQFDAEIVFAACARFGTAVEINCRPERQDPPDELLALAQEWDCVVSIDTDAHAPGQLEWQGSGCDKAVRHGIADDAIINCMSADDLLAWAAN